MPTVKQESTLARIEVRETPHDPIIEANSHDEALAEIARRVANGRADPRGGFLIVPPVHASIEAWEARQPARPTDGASAENLE